ncbi:hypothetical protein [Atopobium deltae]|uniref:Uncharacterized protein n=1 Tax=Atopobium deltae TaxID=1393034 RepID=A0A133XQL5_9ACTN|nr:hypothetical protein [Atopobium deltae]KXB33229.1 hypothetical protein HMPREF3192_01201 [Atopobium deltae]
MNKEIMKEVIKDLENLTAHLKTLFDESSVGKEKSSKPVEKPKQKFVLTLAFPGGVQCAVCS